jgi:hypothetical protein
MSEKARNEFRKNPSKRDYRGRFKKKRYASHSDAREIFARMAERRAREIFARMAERPERERLPKNSKLKNIIRSMGTPQKLRLVRKKKIPSDGGRAIRNDDIGAAVRGLGMFRKSIDELIALYNEYKDGSVFASKVIAEAAKQVALAKGAKLVKR